MRSSEGVTGQGAVRRRSPGRMRGRRRTGDLGRSWCGDRGAVTAEAAVVIPVLVVFAMALLWALVAAADQIRCVDAARAGARAAARSEPEAAVLAAARDTAPRRARVEVGRAGDLWRVRVEAPTPGPGVLSLTLRAEAVALAEDTVGGGGHGVGDVDGL
ncbi:pilus assembly protein TadE [Streptomyces sp. CAI-24]|nr:pilus assembly protein TadE [Streptomyces sp. CAI-24]